MINSTLAALQHKYRNMKVYLTDEISTVTIDAFFKLPPVVPPIVFKLQKGARIYYYLAGNTWHNFNVHELKKTETK